MTRDTIGDSVLAARSVLLSGRSEAIGLTPAQFGEHYSVALRVELTRVRGH
jgi:hypothetical protein